MKTEISLLEHVENAGFRPSDNIIHLLVGGSELHGVELGGTDDRDIYGVFFESPEDILGLDLEERTEDPIT